MALILSIDTSLETAGICLGSEEGILGVKYNYKQQDHATWIHTAIQELLNEDERELHELKAIAVAAGPGSYTGLRVGMATAKGLCYALAVPLVTESTLRLIAYAVKKNLKSGYSLPVLICPMIDARRMEVFTTIYDANGKEVIPPAAMILDQHSFEELLEKNIIVFCGNGCSKWQYICKHPNAVFSKDDYDVADLDTLARKKYKDHQFDQLAYSEPSYLKNVYTGLK